MTRLSHAFAIPLALGLSLSATLAQGQTASGARARTSA